MLTALGIGPMGNWRDGGRGGGPRGGTPSLGLGGRGGGGVEKGLGNRWPPLGGGGRPFLLEAEWPFVETLGVGSGRVEEKLEEEEEVRTSTTLEW